MAKLTEKQNSEKQDTLEIIELASADLEQLSRAFDLITDVCDSFNEQPKLKLSEERELPIVH